MLAGEPMNHGSCPTETQWRAFAVGDLSTAAMDRLERHLESCQPCRDALPEFDSVRDPLLTGLSGRAAVAAPPVPESVLRRAKAAVTNQGADAASEPAIDCGLRLARLLQQGTCRLGRFELLAELGTGSFGYVFRARDLELDRTVAIKVQRAGAFASSEEAGRFLREARSAAGLTHPAIVALYDTGHTDDGVCFLVSEFIEGETLERRLTRGRLDHHAAARLVAELADAVQYAHEHGVVHRDLKPANIILDTSGRPHITDFGLAKRAGAGDPSMTSAGRVMGTPAYMSPEQASGGGQAVDARADVYSLGVMLYELLTGERPFQGLHRLLVLQVLEDEPRPPRQLDHRLPRDLETICLKAMAKSPGRRYPTAAALAEDLRRHARGEPIEARPLGYAGRLWRWCRRYPAAVALLAAVSIGAALGLAHVMRLSAYFVRETALDSARMEADMLDKVNEYYSDLLARLDTRAVTVTHEYMLKRDALPLPATFTIDAGERISASESGLQFRLYSQHPFRADGGPKTDFQRAALALLTARSRERPPPPGPLEHHEFVQIDGRPFLHYARGQIMQESCVKCHNGHPQSPKKDWQVGDLVGVLLITRPLDRDIQRTRSGFESALVMMGATVLLVVGGVIVVAIRSRPGR
jgi:hypothetical protein